MSVLPVVLAAAVSVWLRGEREALCGPRGEGGRTVSGSRAREEQQVSVEQFHSDVGVTIRCWC